MSLLVYKFADYEHTAEREQFRNLTKKLKQLYEGKEELCIFIANYNIFDCELDAILIKQDAIISIEFKNYGGKIIAVDNGQWKLEDGTIVKGGARKSVYQQARINRIAVRDGFREGGIALAKAVKDINALVVFHQDIELENRLSSKTRSWLHICDECTFTEKIEDITSKNTSFTNDDLIKMLVKLNLTDDYLLKEYSDSDLLEIKTSEDKTDDETDFQNASKIADENGLGISHTQNHGISSIGEKSEERNQLKQFASQILKVLLKDKDFKIHVLNSVDADTLFKENGLVLNKEFLITVEGDGLEEMCSRIGKFINHEVNALSSSLIYWEDGEFLDRPIETKEINTLENNKLNYTDEHTSRKTSTVLPHWLDRYIYGELGAIYAPEHNRYEYNLNLDDSETKIYLGTYFPRSYAELFCITNNLFQNQKLFNITSDKRTIKIVDFGCGTGGELIGLLTALDKYFDKIEKVIITALDGNQSALSFLSTIVEKMRTHVKFSIDLELKHVLVKNIDDLKFDNPNCYQYDFILSDKMGCELKSREIINDAYYQIANVFAPLIAESGILIILDVTTKDIKSNRFYPQEMNYELNKYISEHTSYKTLLPLACSSPCFNFCFMQQIFKISHSNKREDQSKVCYRVICRNEFKEQLVPSKMSNVKHIISSSKNRDGNNVACSLSISELTDKEIDSFNINQ